MRRKNTNNFTALITGGTRGIGRAIALSIARNYGGTLILNYLQNEKSASDTCEEIRQIGARCILIRANLNFPKQIESLFEKLKNHTDKLDTFIHSAALGVFKSTLKLKPNQWDLSMNINARSFLLCIQRAVPLMKTASIIAISSLGSHKAVPNYGAIGPSKAALEALVRYAAVGLAGRDIRVNCVAGGFVETESIKLFPDYEILKENIRRQTPAGRLGKPEDIADVVLFLISPAAKWIYGQTIIADGGLSLL